MYIESTHVQKSRQKHHLTSLSAPYVCIFIVLIFFATYFSFKLNSGATMSKEQEDQMKMMSNMMIVFMAITAFTISSGIAIYWIVSNLFTIIQNLIVRRGAKNARN